MPQRTCPKCGYSQLNTVEECSQCGMVFAKYHAARDAMLDRTSARIGEPPSEPKRIRPLTYLLLFAYLAIGWYAIRNLDIWENPDVYLPSEDGISHGGDQFVRKRTRVEATKPVAEIEWEGVTCYGIRVAPDAEPYVRGDGTTAVNHAGEPTEFVSQQPYEEVTQFYRDVFGPTRVFFERVKPPESHPNRDSMEAIDGRRARWYALAESGDGMSMHVDIQVRSPFYDADGTLNADATLVVFSLMR